jgi:uroporphyrin-3 C-methyltransferase
METENSARLPAADKREGGKPDAAPRGGSRRLGVPVGILLLAIALVFAWWLYQRETRERDAAARADATAAQLDALSRSNEQLRRDITALRSRNSDADALNRGIREEVLGFNERARALEDALANLAEQRVGNRDAMALNEAEFILQLAGERLALFRDASGTLAAYQLADSALASAEDPLFANVRQTIRAEMQAIEAAQPMQTRATLKTLADLRARVLSLPLKASPEATPVADTGASGRSRLAELLSRFVRIRHDDTESAFALRDTRLTRSLVALDLRSAEAALFVRDETEFDDALARARTGIVATFDTGTPELREMLSSIDRLAAMPLAPALPELGTALSELRNLRTMRALSLPTAAPPAAAEPGAIP